MTMPRAVVIAAAMLALAILAREGWSQKTTTPFTTAWVVTSCGTPPTVGSGTGWSYSAGGQAPLTMTTGGALCVNQ